MCFHGKTGKTSSSSSFWFPEFSVFSRFSRKSLLLAKFPRAVFFFFGDFTEFRVKKLNSRKNQALCGSIMFVVCIFTKNPPQSVIFLEFQELFFFVGFTKKIDFDPFLA